MRNLSSPETLGIEALFGSLQQQLIVTDGKAASRAGHLKILDELWRTHTQIRRADKLIALHKLLTQRTALCQLHTALHCFSKNAVYDKGRAANSAGTTKDEGGAA